MQKLVSIIIPAYNSENSIAQTIKSAEAQSWLNKEIIVIDDGSTDNTLRIAKTFESGILTVIHTDNRGVSTARNIGLQAAQGEYIQWLDADDILDGLKIEHQVRVLQEVGNAHIAIGPFGSFYFRTEKALFRETRMWQDLSPLECLIARFEDNAWMQIATWLTSRNLVDKVGYWDERLCLDEDGEYFCRIVSRSEGVKYVPNAKAFYRRGNPGALSMNRSDRAMNSLLLSMNLGFKYLRSIEDNERTRRACLNFLGERMFEYYPDNPEMLKNVQNLANEFCGTIPQPSIGWKVEIAKKVIGWRKALILKHLVGRVKTNIWRSWDKMLFNIKRPKNERNKMG